jgi:hypothetical protein
MEETKVETVVTENKQETPTPPETVETNSDVDVKKSNATEVLRELSKQFSVNLFEEGGLETLKGKWQEKETVLTSTKAELDTLSKEKLNFTQLENDYKVQIEALGMGFGQESLEEVLALAKVHAKGNPIQEGLKIVKEKYGNVFTVAESIGLQHNDVKGDKPNIPRTEQEQYMAKNPLYANFDKQEK